MKKFKKKKKKSILAYRNVYSKITLFAIINISHFTEIFSDETKVAFTLDL